MKRGRPSLPVDQKRTEYVGVRVSRAELVKLYALARLFDMDVGQFIRMMTLGITQKAKST